jgi:hypothetical protein
MVAKTAQRVQPGDYPRALDVQPDAIPAELRGWAQWGAWAFEQRKGKWTKVPIDARTGRNASTTDPTTWTTFAEALDYHRAHDSTDGVGFVFTTADPYVGIDLDRAIDPTTGHLHPWAAELVALLDSYTERSPGGGGVKVWVAARLPGEGKGRKRAYEGGAVEAYGRERYFTVTGQHWPGTPQTIEPRQAQLDQLTVRLWPPPAPRRPAPRARQPAAPADLADDEVIRRASAAANGEKFRRLWGGDTSGYPSRSEADLALVSLLAYWVGPDADRIDRLFRASGLARGKWEDRADYRQVTIAKALDGRTDYYTGARPGASPSRNGTAQGQVLPEAEGVPDPTPAPPAAHTLGPLTLHPGRPHATPSGKVTLRVTIRRDGRRIDVRTLSTAPSARQDVARQLARLLADDPEASKQIDATLAALLADAAEDLERPASATGGTIREIVKAYVPQRWQLVCRTARGAAWSEACGCEITRQQFIADIPEALMREAGRAADAPRDVTGRPVRADLLRAVEIELRILWADLMAELPAEADVDMGADTARGRQMRAALVQLWTRPRLLEQIKGTEAGSDVASSASLVSRVRSRAAGPPQAREAWRPIHAAYAAWWRRYPDPDGGEVRIALAMRWELGAQIGVDLPGITDQAALTTLGERFGVIDPKPPLSDRLSDGGRLAVLVPDLTDELLAQPVEPDPSDDHQEASSDVH